MIDVEQVKKLMRRKTPEYTMDPANFLSTGSTMLNCGLTDNPFCGYEKGLYYLLVGDSQSGKTFFTMNAFAQASIDESFNDYRFIYNCTEYGMKFDVIKYFGKAVAKRLEAPAYTEDGQPMASEYLEDFYSHARQSFKKGPCLYILDSIDALTTRQEMQKEEKTEQEIQSGKAITGEMSDGKAKINSSKLRRLLNPMKEHGSILIIVVQTRDNLGMGFAEKTRSGGRALKFYATSEIWTSVKKTLTKEIKGKKRKYGINVQMDIRKNRHSDHVGAVDIPILAGYGFDDIGSCIDWLTDNEHWKKSGPTISAPEFSEEKLKRESLIRLIEEKKNGEYRLAEIVGEVWNGIREAMRPNRKPRYV